MAIFFEVDLQNHHRVTAAAEVGNITKFFGEDIAGVDDTRYVLHLCYAELMCLAYVIFFEIHVFCAFVGDGG